MTPILAGSQRSDDTEDPGGRKPGRARFDCVRRTAHFSLHPGRLSALGALALVLVACGQPAPPPRRLDPGAAPIAGQAADVTGAVVALDATTVRVQPAGGAALVVATAADTTVFALAPGTPLDLAAGDRVVIAGERDGATFSARALADLGPASDDGQGPPAPAGGVTGVISAVVGDVVTVRDQDGALVTALLDTGTAIRVERPGALADLRPGDTVALWGAATGPGAYLARMVVDWGPVAE